MLLIHPASCCDVCLDAYNFETPAQTPHAIPCGHIFCKTCLTSVIPTNCPLCRKGFDPSRAKKLHVDRPDAVLQDQDTKESILLQRMMTAWDLPEDELQELMNEVQQWLQERSEDACIPLRKSRRAMQKYLRLKAQARRDQKTIRNMEKSSEERERLISYEKDVSRVVEQSLQAQVDELETKTSRYQSELEELKAELARFQAFRHSPNPLPAPPEPIPLDRFPNFAQAAAAGSGAIMEPSSSTNLYSRINEAIANPYSNTFDRDGNTYGYSSNPAPYNEADNRNTIPSNQDESQRRRDRKGPYPLTPKMPTHSVVPGASPNSRIVPPSEQPASGDRALSSSGTQNIDPARDTLDPYTLTAAYIQEYVNGYDQGFRTASTSGRPSDASFSNARAMDASAPRGLDNLDPIRSALLETAVSDQQQMSFTGSSVTWENGAWHSRPSLRETQSDGTIGTSSSSGDIDSMYARPGSARRLSTQSDTDTIYSSTASERRPSSPSSRMSAPEPPPVQLRQGSQFTQYNVRSNRNSNSSWGTIHTVSDRDSNAGSFTAEFGLRGFGRGTGVVVDVEAPGSGTLPFYANPFGYTQAQNVEEEERRHSSVTPTNAEPPANVSFSGYRLASESSNASLPMSGDNSESSGATARRSGRRSEHRRRSRSRNIQLRPSTSMEQAAQYNAPSSAPAGPPSLWTDVSHLSEPPQSADEYWTESSGNALGLALDQEPSRTPQITAPTPRFSTNHFLRSFSYDRSA